MSIISFQSISPGLVESENIASGSDNEMLKFMPRLKPEDVAKAVLFAISTPDHVQVILILICFLVIIKIRFLLTDSWDCDETDGWVSLMILLICTQHNERKNSSIILKLL